jgi:hypothetical protein
MKQPDQDSARNSTERLSHWARRIESLSEELPRTLSLLRDIENTLKNLERERGVVEYLSSIFKDETDKLNALRGKNMLDKDGELQKMLLKGQEKLREHHLNLKSGCDSAKSDSRLRVEDGIVDEYCRYMGAVGDLHNDINALRWALAEHDAECSKIVGNFANTEDLAKFLNRKQA